MSSAYTFSELDAVTWHNQEFYYGPMEFKCAVHYALLKLGRKTL